MTARPMLLVPPRVIVLRSRGLGTTFSAPVSGTVSSDFGPRPQPTAGASTDHKGIDYAVPVGTPVAASAGGRVKFAGVQSGFGNVVQIDHGGGVVSTYAHLSQIYVSAGQTVGAGAIVGLSGATGTVTGPNLHFGISVNGVYVDPETYLVRASLPNLFPPASNNGDLIPFDVFPDMAAVDFNDPLTIALTVGVLGLAALVVLS